MKFDFVKNIENSNNPWKFNNLLYKIKIYLTRKNFDAYNQIQGWLTNKEALALFLISKALPKNAQIVEIGSWKGKSTFIIAKGLKSGVVNAIDPFNAVGEENSSEVYAKAKGNIPLEDEFIANMKNNRVYHKIKMLKGYSSDFVGTIKEIDFLFIDGDHSIEGCTYDFEKYYPFIKKNGLIAFHDYVPKAPNHGPTEIIDNSHHIKNNFKFIALFDTLWVGQKIK